MQTRKLWQMHKFGNCGFRFEDAPKELELKQLICHHTTLEEIVPLKYTLNGRDRRMIVSSKHFVFPAHDTIPPFPPTLKTCTFSMGAFWRAEAAFLQLHGIYSTSVGYSGGDTPNPTYKEVGTGLTNHAQCVRVVYDPRALTFQELCEVFWETHDPTQGMKQGNDIGTPFRSILFYNTQEEKEIAETSLATYQKALFGQGKGAITTKIENCKPYYYAEDYHQQYLFKNNAGYQNSHDNYTPEVYYPKDYNWENISRIEIIKRKYHVVGNMNEPEIRRRMQQF